MSEKFYVDLETIQQLADIVTEKDLGEITIADGTRTITVKGRKCVPQPPMGFPPMAMPAGEPVAAPTPVEAAPAKPAAPTGKLVKAPIVGTFYAAAAPDQPPFVKVGDTIQKGDVLFIIESMKLMNEVQSEISGVVKEILVGNGEAVEYDQPILRVE
jgi:acetyl-CoA carboxylase biotin carboxyl carrier protein